MDVRILGQMEAWRSGKEVDLGPPKQRLTLAILVLHAGQPVSLDYFVDQLWDGRPPASAQQNVYLHIHRLRRALGADCLVTCGRLGYKLMVSRGQVDAYRFSDRVDETHLMMRVGDHLKAAILVREALAEWRGDAFAGLPDHPALQAEAARLGELRQLAIEYQIDFDLMMGDHLGVIAKLRSLVAAHPYRERLHEQLMVALHRAGRTAEALAAFQDIKRNLASDLGIDPGIGLLELQRRILNADPDLVDDAPRVALQFRS